MPNIIQITEKYLIAKGGERSCYEHPEDPTKVLKIVHRKVKHNQQNLLESIYYNYLFSNNIPTTYLAQFYGNINTNLGNALIYERICDYNNQQSLSLKETIIANKLEEKIKNQLVNELKEYIFKNNILFIDVDLSNVFCCEYEENKYKLIIIDGLGARRIGWRFNFYLKSKLFTKYKIKKQWKKFIENIKKLDKS